MPFVGGCSGKYRGRYFGGGILQRSGGSIVVCEELVDESPVMGGRVYDLCE